MEGRMKKYRQVSPERAKVWTEKSPKYYYNYDHYNRQKQQRQARGKVPVIYYLCRNQQLEHPHFMEVPLSSPDGLYLRDVVEKLNALRGRGMASMYSWSCKRSYKSGYVWHDLCEDDLILPSHGNEYVLKGSELFEESNHGRFSPSPALLLQNQKALPEPPSSRSQESSSSSSLNGGMTAITSQDEDVLSPPLQRPSSSTESKNSSWNGSLSLTEYNVYKSDGLADASTQTEDKPSIIVENGKIRTRGVSTDDDLLQHGHSVARHNERGPLVSPPPSTPSTPSSSGRTDTLESLIRADARKLSRLRILEGDEFRTMQTSTRFKASNMILQLVSCGSISVKDDGFGLGPMYNVPKLSHSKFSSSPFFSTSLMVGEKEYFSGSIIESKVVKESLPAFKRSSSYDEERSAQKLEPIEDEEDSNSSGLKCIPRSIKASLSKQPKSESMRSPTSEGPRISSSRFGSSRIASTCTSNGGSKRMTADDVKMGSSSVNGNENVIKIEERLASGARVIIQSKISVDE